MFTNTCFSLACFIGIYLCVATRAVEVDTNVGKIRGVTETINGRNVDTYLGIPYSKPREDETRFTDPVKPDSFTGIYDATQEKAECHKYPHMIYQGVPREITFSEDCLYLNVYVPSPVKTDTPVLVWIPGTDFRSGGGHSGYDGEQMAITSDIIVVTFEYRLWVFGFLSTNDDHAKGNYGLKDQTMALQWVKDNIAAFGGNPDRITIAGSSSGAVSVGLHTISAMSKGLFQKAIMQSGAASAPWAINTDPYKSTLLLARRHGCAPLLSENIRMNQDVQDIMDCLRMKTAEDLMAESQMVVESQAVVDKSLNLIWTPVVDGDFLTDTPQALLSDVQHLADVGFYSYDILLGINSWEGMSIIYKIPEVSEKYVMSVMNGAGIERSLFADGIVPTLLRQKYGNANELSKKSVLFSYNNVLEQPEGLVEFPDAYRLYGDVWYNVPVIQTAKMHAMAASAGRTYLYLFDYEASLGVPLELKGATHLQEIPYLFNFGPKSSTVVPSNDERALSFTMMLYWRNFIRNGDPNVPTNDLIPVIWPAYDLASQQYLILSGDMSSQDSSVGQRLFDKRADFWTGYLDEVNTAYDAMSRTCNDTLVITVVSPIRATDNPDVVIEPPVTAPIDTDTEIIDEPQSAEPIDIDTDTPEQTIVSNPVIDADSTESPVPVENTNCPPLSNNNNNHREQSQTIGANSDVSNTTVVALGVTTGIFAAMSLVLSCLLCIRCRRDQKEYPPSFESQLDPAAYATNRSKMTSKA